MKKTILYTLLFSGILFILGVFTYKQYEYKKFEDFFMNSKIYGGKIALDVTLTEHYKKMGLNVKIYKYSFFLKSKMNPSIYKEFFVRRSFDKDLKIVGGSGAVGDFFNIPIFHIENKIYADFISEKWIPNKKIGYYVVVEYEKKRQIRYYVEITEKLENKEYTIYFKSYPPKKILNAKNQYIKD